MVDKGYVLLHRKIIGSDIFEDERLLKVFIWCVFRACFKPSKVCGIQLDRGEFATSTRRAAAELCIPRSSVHRLFKKLDEGGTISVKKVRPISGRSFIVVTVLKYSTYQDPALGLGTDDETEVRQSRTRSGTKVGQEERMCKERNNISMSKGDEKTVETATELHPPVGKLADLWNEKAAKHSSLSRVVALSGSRVSKAKARLKDGSFMDLFVEALDHIPVPNRPGFNWQPNFDWMIANETNVLKLVEDKYGKTGPSGPKVASQSDLDAYSPI